ncbi:MAG: Metallo-beta-lactamase superfamily protein, partial [Myxococcaceae bacterium]|nr:Metallo-beta-lactamase superfamily protein [Myxococcaceae bacterium]
MTSLRARFEAYWDGSLDPTAEPPMYPLMTHEEVADRSLFVSSFANVTALRTDEGLVLVDAGGPMLAAQVHAAVRSWSDDPVRAVIYTHGHVDHVVGVERFEAEGRGPFTVYGHEAVNDRFARYAISGGYNACVNARQFQVQVAWPKRFRAPDETYRDALALTIGGEPIELHHARGETDDATWVWLPGRKLLCAGDLFIWAAPNAGNPQKVQRYPREWAVALRAMATLDAEVMLPGHGLPIYGRERIVRALTETAALLEFLHDETLARMNAGMRLDDIVREVLAPPELLARPYLRPFYDEPEFVVRNVWRLYGGWWDGDPTRLQPAPAAALARELCALGGGAAAMAA